MIKDKHQYHVCGWMINQLHLEGRELQCYAIIYSLSQLGEGRYIAGLKFLAEFMQCSQPTASSAVKGLFKKELIKKDEVVNEYGRRVFYYCTDPDIEEVDKSDEGGEKENDEGVNKKFMDGVNKKFMPKYNNKENKEKDLSKAKSKKGGVSLTPEEQEKEDKFRKAMRERYPRFMMMESPLTYKQSQELKKDYEDDEILQALEEIECWKPLLKKRVDAFRTIKNWINKNRERA